jgi:Condensation domain
MAMWFERNILSFSRLVLPSIFTPEKIRDLDSYEEFFWLLEQSVPMLGVIAAEVDGETTVAQWEHALMEVQGRYPLLSASIRKASNQRPYFARTSGTQIPLQVSVLSESTVLSSEMEEVLQNSFGDGSGSLLRISLFHREKSCVLLLAMHHAAFDGKSGLLILGDLLRTMARETMGPSSTQAISIRDVLGQPPLPSYRKLLKNGKDPHSIDSQVHGLPKVLVTRLVMNVKETRALLDRVKHERASVTSAIMVALTLAGTKYRPAWRNEPVQCISPVDMRRKYGVEDASGLLIGLHHVPLEATADLPFWDKARYVRGTFDTLNTEEIFLRGLRFHDDLVLDEQSPSDAFEIATGFLTHDFMVTNYAGLDMRTDYGELRIASLFTGSASADPQAQKVSVLTLHGRLGMTLVSRMPIPNLLEEARTILADAVNELSLHDRSSAGSSSGKLEGGSHGERARG